VVGPGWANLAAAMGAWSVVASLVLGRAAALVHAGPLPRGSADHHDILAPHRTGIRSSPSIRRPPVLIITGRRLPG
jgi:hypothetical protein